MSMGRMVADDRQHVKHAEAPEWHCEGVTE